MLKSNASNNFYRNFILEWWFKIKNITPVLQEFLLTNTVFQRADLIAIQLPNGQTLNTVYGTNSDVIFTGNASALAVTNASQSGSGTAWLNITGVESPASYANTTLTTVTNASSNLLNCENPGFSVSSGAGPIVSVTVTCTGYCVNTGTGIPQLQGQLLVGGSPFGTAQAFTYNSYAGFPTTPTVLTIANLLYPSTLTYAQVNAANFGVQIQALITGPSAQSATIYLQNVQISVVWSGGAGSTTYYVSQYGSWERDAFTNSAKYKPEASSTNLRAFIPESVLFPGTTTPFMQVINAGILNGSIVNIQTLFWPPGQSYTTGIGMGTMQLTNGQIGNVKNAGRSNIVCELFDFLYILNRQFPPHQIQSACRHSLFDPGCTLLLADYESTNVTLDSSSTNLYLNLDLPVWQASHAYTAGNIIIAATSYGAWSSSTNYVAGDLVTYNSLNYIAVASSLNKVPLNNPNYWDLISDVVFMCTTGGTSGGSFPTFNYNRAAITDDGSTVKWTSMNQSYPLGYVYFTGGQNSGLKYSVKVQTCTSTGLVQLQLTKFTILPVAGGDTVQIVPGCDKQLVTCINVYDNLLHFGGMPYCPNPEVAV